MELTDYVCPVCKTRVAVPSVIPAPLCKRCNVRMEKDEPKTKLSGWIL